jgi:N-acetylglucosaminyl-diphospho-decaprenol L-rhamnosyltransferase
MDMHRSALLSPVKVSAKPALRHSRRPALSVVIVNYQRWEDTGRVVRQLRAEPALRRGDAEVVIVDNHSPAHPLVPRLRRADGVSLRRWRSNRGFSRAVNEGCRLSRGDWLLLLNPDTTVSPGFIEQALKRAGERLANDPRAGIVGFRLENPDGSHQLSTGQFPDLFGTIARLPLPRRRRKYSTPDTTQPAKVDWVTGCCLLVRRECWDDLGGLDPDFFLYYEDVDLCRRAAERGWSVWYDPAVSIEHLRPLHLRPVPAHLRLLTRHALLTYARKHWPAWQTRVLGGIVKVESVVRRLWAWMTGDDEASTAFAALGRIAEDVPAKRVARARRRLLRVVRGQEQHRVTGSIERGLADLSSAVDCHPQPQPC